jgi:hypothetical protein
MTNKEKNEFIQNFKEDELREKLLVPLLSKMGFIDPIIHHHSNEKGKDIIFKEYDSKFKKTNYIAVVVKAGDVNGSASGSSSYFTLINQVKQALNEPYKHIYDLNEVNIDRVLIVISGRFLPTSLESIYGTLKAEKIDKAIREPIDINKLTDLIDEYFKEFWEEAQNEKKALIDQRNYLLNNFSKISKIIFPAIKDQDSFLKKVASAEIEINLLPYKSITRYIADIGYRSIDIDEIDEFYTDNKISNGFCDIKEYIFKLKKDVRRVLYQIDEPAQILKSILNEKNPDKIVELCEDLSGFIGHYGLHINTDGIESQEDFEYALNDYKNKKDFLRQNKLEEFYQNTWEIISKEAKANLMNFFNQHSKEEKNIWLGMSININILMKKLLELKFYNFVEEPKIIKHDSTFGFHDKETTRQRIENESIIIIEYALNNYGFGQENEYSVEKKANASFFLYTNGFEKGILKIIGYNVDE